MGLLTLVPTHIRVSCYNSVDSLQSASVCLASTKQLFLVTQNALVRAYQTKPSCCIPVGCIYLCDSDDTTTTRAGAERRSTSCRHWTSRKWPRWQIWKVDSRPSSVRLHGWVHTAALHTRMCKGLLWEQQKIKHALLLMNWSNVLKLCQAE